MAQSDRSTSDVGRRDRVLITGIGVVSTLGLGMEALADGLWDFLTYVSNEQDPAETSEAATADVTPLKVPEFRMSDYVGTTRPYLDRHSQFGLAAASMALGSTKAERTVPDPVRSGLASATVFGNMATAEIFQAMVRQKGVRLASPMLFPHSYANSTNSLISIEFGLRGYNQNFSGDSMSGAKAVLAGAHAIRSGAADMMLAGGCEALSESITRILAGEMAAGGIPPSEGACILRLENEASLTKRTGAVATCELASIVTRSTRLTEPAKSKASEIAVSTAISSAIGSALTEAALWEGDIGVLFVATPGGDDPISRGGTLALRSFSQVPVVSLKHFLEETWSAGFPLGCAAATAMLQAGSVPLPPELRKVEKGVEFWTQQEPARLLGAGALVVQWSAHSVIVAVLKRL